MKKTLKSLLLCWIVAGTSLVSTARGDVTLEKNQEATIGTYPRTSDYWRGDESKFIECFNNSKVIIGPLELDENTNSHSVQVSIPIEDAGDTIGVLVVGLRNIKQRNN